MKHYESYVAEAKARRRRQLAIGVVGAVMLATLAVTALVVFSPPEMARAHGHREQFHMNRHSPSPTWSGPTGRATRTRSPSRPPWRRR